MKYCLAVDIGASSGRHIVGWEENGEIQTEEIFRFQNGVQEMDGHLVWDIVHLENAVREGIDNALERYPIESLSIDTWGVDYVLLRGDERVMPVYSYRDHRTGSVIDAVHERIPFEELYAHTGSQFQTFNTIYQIYTDKLTGRLDGVTDFLMIPEYLMYRLTGVKKKEFTNATTTGMIDHETLEFDQEIITQLGLPEHLFPKLDQPGDVVGEYRGIKVVLCATHDTGSAVEGIPMEGDELYISSGTWSLLGVKTPKPITGKQAMKANYSNEGGVGYNRFQKNIMGMWLINGLRRELCPEESFADIVTGSEVSSFDEILDANHPTLLAPKSLKEAFDALLKNKPVNRYDYFRCACRSLAESYRQAIEELESITGKQYRKLYIVGGGARNRFLNRLTEELTGKQVIALPIEATALGSLKIQMDIIQA